MYRLGHLGDLTLIDHAAARARHHIIEEYPVVVTAYSDGMPSKLTEAEFWKRRYLY